MCYDKDYKPCSLRAYRYRANKVLCELDFERECMICGSRNDVHCHHIDGNETNNTPFNLMFLCKFHHSIVHNGKVIFGDD